MSSFFGRSGLGLVNATVVLLTLKRMVSFQEESIQVNLLKGNRKLNDVCFLLIVFINCFYQGGVLNPSGF